jgi:iron complex transport system substrate-binding protein
MRTSRTTLIGYAAWYFELGRLRPRSFWNIAARSSETLAGCDIPEVTRIATLSEMLEEVVHLGEATGMEEHGHELRGELEGRLAAIRAVVAGAATPRVIALESLDPPRVAGFWIPEMISIAGGDDVAGDPGLGPAAVRWGELAGLDAEVALVLPPGAATDSQAQAMEHWEQIEALGPDRIFALDGDAFAEPTPRLVDGVELLAHLLHPDLVPPPGNTEFSALAAPASRA